MTEKSQFMAAVAVWPVDVTVDPLTPQRTEKSPCPLRRVLLLRLVPPVVEKAESSG
jgi:hypothetical protein